MERNQVDLPADKIAALDLESLVRKADQLNEQNRQANTSHFPKDPSRWLSHYVFEPRPITFTSEGEVQGGLSLLAASLFDLSFVRGVFAPHYSGEGGHCFDPATLFFLQLAARLDGYGNDADFCKDCIGPNDLRQQENAANSLTKVVNYT